MKHLRVPSEIPSISRQRYFDITVHIKEIKDAISGSNELEIIKVLNSLGFKKDKDYFRQYPLGQRFVLDFAFPNERVGIEIDGKSHDDKKQALLDIKRDSYLRSNGWIPIRIKDKEFFGYKELFYKNLIREVVEDRRRDYENGDLLEINYETFNFNDYGIR